MKVSKKQKVINAARESFHRYGYAGTSVNAITEASGVSMTNFYYHFKSKQALAMIIIEDLSREMEQDIFRETILNKSLSPLRRLNSYYDKIVEKCILDEYMGCFLGNLALEQSGVSEDFRSVLSTLFQRWKGMIAECISDGIKAGCFSRNIDPESMASLIYSHIHGAYLLSKTHKSAEVFRNSLDEMMKLITVPQSRQDSKRAYKEVGASESVS